MVEEIKNLLICSDRERGRVAAGVHLPYDQHL